MIGKTYKQEVKKKKIPSLQVGRSLITLSLSLLLSLSLSLYIYIYIYIYI